jgi:hypothetical protein
MYKMRTTKPLLKPWKIVGIQHVLAVTIIRHRMDDLKLRRKTLGSKMETGNFVQLDID